MMPLFWCACFFFFFFFNCVTSCPKKVTCENSLRFGMRQFLQRGSLLFSATWSHEIHNLIFLSFWLQILLRVGLLVQLLHDCTSPHPPHASPLTHLRGKFSLLFPWEGRGAASWVTLFLLDFACWVVCRCHLLPQSFLKLKKLELKSASKCPQGQELQITALFVFLVSFRFGLIMIKSLMLLKDRTIISIFGCLQGAVSRDGLNTSQSSTRNHSNSTWRFSAIHLLPLGLALYQQCRRWLWSEIMLPKWFLISVLTSYCLSWWPMSGVIPKSSVLWGNQCVRLCQLSFPSTSNPEMLQVVCLRAKGLPL